jgi:predicted ATPase
VKSWAKRRTGDLPAETTSFVGRRDELAQAARLMPATRLVTLTGPGGVGKTRVALRLAASQADCFADGVRLVDLSVLQDADLLVHAVCEAAGVRDQTARSQLDVLADHLRGKQMLLLFDTCEHLLWACAELAETLLKAAPGLRILATSRQPLGTCSERILPISPLPVQAAMTLLQERAGGFALTPRNRADAITLCQRLEGIPLAIELAAIQLRTMPIEQIIGSLDDRFGLLGAGADGAAARHHALRTTVGWSHELCTEPERLLWARLSVFAGSFDLDAAEYVCRDQHLPAADIPTHLAGLAAKSIVGREDGAAGPRYRMLDTLRDYGHGWLRALGEQDALRQRHRDWFIRLAETDEARWFGPDQTGTFARTHAEHANYRTVLASCLSTSADAQAGLRLAAALWFYWAGCGFLAEGRHWLDQALAIPARDSRARAKALWVCGYVTILQGDIPAARGRLDECLDLGQRTDDKKAVASAIHRHGCAALIGDDHAVAEARLADALTLYSAVDEMNSTVIMAKVELAMAIAFQGDLRRASVLCEQATADCERHGERWARAYAQYVLAFIAFTDGDPRRATALAHQCLRTGQNFHDLVGMVLAIELLALFAAAGGAPERGAVLQGAASQIWPSVGLPLFGSRYFNDPHLRCEALARQALTDDGYAASFGYGAGLRMDDAISFALGEESLSYAGV